jgi:hypothetical protein
VRKAFTLFAAVSAVVSGAAVMQLKLAVQDQADQVKAIAKQIHADQSDIRVLEAEWAYLTSPVNLQEKSIEFLALMPPRAKQVLNSADEVPLRANDKAVDPNDDVLLPTPTKVKPLNKKARGKGVEM